MKNKKDNALLFAGTTPGLNNFVLAANPATEEFRYSSPVLIISSTTKNSGVIKYNRDNSVSNVKNDNSRPADHWGVVTIDANRVNHLFDRPDFGNHEAGAN